MGWVHVLSMSLLYTITQNPSHIHKPPHLSYTLSTGDLKIRTTLPLSSRFRPGLVSDYRHPNFPNATSALREGETSDSFYVAGIRAPGTLVHTPHLGLEMKDEREGERERGEREGEREYVTE